ncbi:MAG: Dabb family protein [Chromatiales bacterium]|jgi:fructose-bisphosphate aldolase class II
MAVLNFSDLLSHSKSHHYKLPAINVQSLSVLKGMVAWGKQHDAPFIVTIDGPQIENGLIPSIEELLRNEDVASLYVARRISTKDQAHEAIRSGCQALFLDSDCIEQDRAEIKQIANSCGILCETEESFASYFLVIDEPVDFAEVMKAAQQVSGWQQFDETVTKAVIDSLSAILDQVNVKGMATGAKAECKPYAPVEHLIIYNSSASEEQTQQAVQIGTQVLDKIPGVRATWSGEAIAPNAKYRRCWLFRFANESVIDSYREHPDHLAYADEYFRPIAADRISIDFTLSGPDTSD